MGIMAKLLIMGNTGFISSIVGVGFGESYAIDMVGALRDSLGSHSSFDTLGLENIGLQKL